MGIENWLKRNKTVSEPVEVSENSPCNVNAPTELKNLPPMEKKALMQWSSVFFGEVASDEYTKRFVKCIDIRMGNMDSWTNIDSENRLEDLVSCYKACFERVFTKNNIANIDMLYELVCVITTNLVHRMIVESCIYDRNDWDFYCEGIDIFEYDVLKAIYISTMKFCRDVSLNFDFADLYEHMDYRIPLSFMEEKHPTMAMFWFFGMEDILKLPEEILKYTSNNNDRIEAVHFAERILSRYSWYESILNGEEFVKELKKFATKESAYLKENPEELLYDFFVKEDYYIYDDTEEYDFKLVNEIVSVIPKYFPKMITPAYTYQLKFMLNYMPDEDKDDCSEFEEMFIELLKNMSVYKLYRSEEFNLNELGAQIINAVFDNHFSGVTLNEIYDILTKDFGISEEKVKFYIVQNTLSILEWHWHDHDWSFSEILTLLSNSIVYEVVAANNPAIIDCYKP